MMFLILLLAFVEPKIVALDKLQHEIIAPDCAWLEGNLIAFFDSYDHKVKVFRCDLEKSHFEHLWSSKGRGKGPGEFTDDFNNLVLTSNQEWWVSHLKGFSKFDSKGVFIELLKSEYNRSKLAHESGYIYATSPDPLFNRVMLRKLDPANSRTLWSLPYPYGISITESERYLQPEPELASLDSGVVIYDPPISKMIRVSASGEILWQADLGYHILERAKPIDTVEKIKKSKSYGVFYLKTPRSGLAVHEGFIYALTFHHVKGIVSNGKKHRLAKRKDVAIQFRIVEKVHLGQGTRVERRVFKQIAEDHLLVGVWKGQLVFLDFGNADKLVMCRFEDGIPVTGFY